MKISIIGYGNMSKALCDVWLQNPEYHLYVSAPTLTDECNHPRFHKYTSNIAILEHADLLVLAVKPAQMQKVLKEIHKHLPSKLGIISVAAGLNFQWLQTYLPLNTPIIRAMPNLAAAFKESATPLIANPWVSQAQCDMVTGMFQQCGLIQWITQEEQLDVYTALSGSGLAYFHTFAQAMYNAAIHLGLEENIAQTFTLQTLKGAASLANSTGQTFAELQERITSKAGTTAAALEVFEKKHLSDMVLSAMQAAIDRSKNLRTKE